MRLEAGQQVQRGRANVAHLRSATAAAAAAAATHQLFALSRCRLLPAAHKLPAVEAGRQLHHGAQRSGAARLGAMETLCKADCECIGQTTSLSCNVSNMAKQGPPNIRRSVNSLVRHGACNNWARSCVRACRRLQTLRFTVPKVLQLCREEDSTASMAHKRSPQSAGV
jgi:hypothetical protein